MQKPIFKILTLKAMLKITLKKCFYTQKLSDANLNVSNLGLAYCMSWKYLNTTKYCTDVRLLYIKHYATKNG